MKKLSYLLNEHQGISLEVDIQSITNNSREVTTHSLFLAFPGVHVDARQFIADAISQGASAIFYENSDGFRYDDDSIPCIGVADLKSKQALIAARFYDFPGKKIPVIGVTGTNGKTSVTQFIAQLLDKTAVIGTLGYGFPGDLKKLPNTTPDGLQLQKILFELINAGAKTIVMEVSSHGLVENRVAEIAFQTAVFTNLTQDHLDFHVTMENYQAAKELLFQMPGLKNAVINMDDHAGKYFAEKYHPQLRVLTYSKNNPKVDVFVLSKNHTETGFDLTIQTPKEKHDFHLPLIGEFNIDNILAVIGVFLVSNHDSGEAWRRISNIVPVPGRMQLFKKKQSPSVIIDYAHTPDALEKALQSVRVHCKGKLFCIFGCGGNRDKTKRPKMGAIASRYADSVMITNDNPRDENPEIIAAEIAMGVSGQCDIELDRALAIKKILEKAGQNDWVLIAGKGHETDQIIGKKTLNHSDAECVTSYIVP